MEKTTGNYELLYIVHPDLESSIDKILERVRGYIEKRDGKITYDENWGKRKLAYEINKTDVGIYILWYFTAPKKAVIKIEKDIRLTEEIMRYIILTVQDEKKKEKPKKKKTEKVSTTDENLAAAETTEAPKKKADKPVKKESEKARMKKIDEKLNKLLGEEDNKKEAKKKEA